MNNVADISGNKYGKLTVVSFALIKNGRSYWNCICDCGCYTIKMGKSIINGDTKSCGCIHRNMIIERNKKNAIHGLGNSPLYSVWSAMIDRCDNPKNKRYNRYGGRGIGVCSEWYDFKVFYDDMISSYESGLSLDRENNDGNYEPSNCRWVTEYVQRRNKSSNIFITHNGETRIMSDWAKIFDMKPSVLSSRIRRGCPFDIAISAPLQKGKAILKTKKV